MRKERIKNGLMLFAFFFKIGCFTFGGGWSILAQMEQEFVDKQKADHKGGTAGYGCSWKVSSRNYDHQYQYAVRLLCRRLVRWSLCGTRNDLSGGADPVVCDCILQGSEKQCLVLCSPSGNPLRGGPDHGKCGTCPLGKEAFRKKIGSSNLCSWHWCCVSSQTSVMC